MPIHVTIDPLLDDGMTVEEYARAMEQLKPASVAVDVGGSGVGRVLLASLQARGIPAHALERRERPTLQEVQRVTELSREVEQLKHEAELQSLELRHLREYQRDVRVLIQRLE